LTDALDIVNKHRMTRGAAIRSDMDQFDAHRTEHGTDFAEWQAKLNEWEAAIDEAEGFGARVAAVLTATRPELPPRAEPEPEPRAPRGRPKAYFIRQRI
jgi:hypothetical protein